MKKVITSIAAFGLLAGSLLVPASVGKAQPQVVEGSIALPAPFAQGTFAGCWGGATRRTTTIGQGQPNGVVGYVFDVDKATWGGKFVLEATGGEGTVDLDLFMYSHYPAVEETETDPVNGGTPVSVDFQTRAEGGEDGLVPPGTVKAIVCMYAGPEHQGFNSTFKYTATPPVKKKK